MKIINPIQSITQPYFPNLCFTVAKKLSDYIILFKARLSFFVVFTSSVSFLLALHSHNSILPFAGKNSILVLAVSFLTGILFIVWGANAFNQIFERKFDALMSRTLNRPIPKGRLDIREAYIVSILISIVGFILLMTNANFLTVILAFIAFFNYIFFYTPLKQKNELCTAVGAISGAIPIVMGYTAITAGIDILAILLFSILFLWQFPHFFAIGYIYKDDYKKAGFVITPVSDVKGKKTAFYIILSSILLILTTLLVVKLNFAGTIFLGGASLIGLLLLFRTIDFYLNMTQERAWNLRSTCFLYLPALLIFMVVDKVNILYKL